MLHVCFKRETTRKDDCSLCLYANSCNGQILWPKTECCTSKHTRNSGKLITFRETDYVQVEEYITDNHDAVKENYMQEHICL